MEPGTRIAIFSPIAVEVVDAATRLTIVVMRFLRKGGRPREAEEVLPVGIRPRIDHIKLDEQTRR
jgi:hypothetical protein